MLTHNAAGSSRISCLLTRRFRARSRRMVCADRIFPATGLQPHLDCLAAPRSGHASSAHGQLPRRKGAHDTSSAIAVPRQIPLKLLVTPWGIKRLGGREHAPTAQALRRSVRHALVALISTSAGSGEAGLSRGFASLPLRMTSLADTQDAPVLRHAIPSTVRNSNDCGESRARLAAGRRLLRRHARRDCRHGSRPLPLRLVLPLRTLGEIMFSRIPSRQRARSARVALRGLPHRFGRTLRRRSVLRHISDWPTSGCTN